ncbi:MAG: ABC transporter ATP-binding protein [Chitinophagaceae bacterium]|nr:ABC transporter ATP-binding protein [Chitinophagaceae bacterium]
MAFLEVKHVSRIENGITLLRETSFVQAEGEKIVIAGETGSGKTSLLKIIAGLIQPIAGEVFFQDVRVPGPLEKLLPGHPAIAYLSQYFELRNNYRVEEELECRNLLTGEEAMTIYKVCQVDHLLKRKTNQLSGGERQRIVLARLLTTTPKLLLLDEPFSNMDMAHKRAIKKVIHDIGEQLGISCIIVSHEPTDTLSWADRILVLKDGK